MKRHLAYLSYVLRHKWFVFLAGLRIGAPLHRLIIHDWSKFLPSEWMPYARSFYAPDGTSRFKKDKFFDLAWNAHQKRNKHHWQHWILRRDDGREVYLPMPKKYVLEMVADWMGAGRAITGEWEVLEWYEENQEKIKLHGGARSLVQQTLEGIRKNESNRLD